jgi:hypothetical protein
MISTLPENTGQALPLTAVKAEKSYYIIRVGELTHFLYTFYPDPKTITFEGR